MRYLAHILITLAMITASAYSTAQCGGPVPKLCDADGDYDVDSNDIAAIGATKGTPSSGSGDLRDVDGDGMITVLDARQCVQSCTLPKCANTPTTPNVTLNLHKLGSSTGVLSVKTPASEELVCGVDCDDLALELPQGTPVTLEAQTSPDTILWSWGGLPCDQLSNSCEFAIEEDIARNVSFEYAELDSSTFPVPAHEAFEYEEPNSGVRVRIPAGATIRDTNARLLIATSESGERLFKLQFLKSDDWLQGQHRFTIDMTSLLREPVPQVEGIQAMSAAAQVLDTEIHPAQREAPFISYRPNWYSIMRVENRLIRIDGLALCDQIENFINEISETTAECSMRDHALTTARCTTDLGEHATGTCIGSAWPVILINGYKTFDGIGDPELDTSAADYWHDLPYALHSEGFAPYTFRWVSAQRFQDAAASLREAVVEISKLHPGKPPVLIAHSFGGLVARMYLQGADNSESASVPSESVVRGLITIGTPHSGIAQEGTIEGHRYPSGVDTLGSAGGLFIDHCRQISCYQAGLDEDFFPDIDLMLGDLEDFRILFGITFPGETIHRLSYPAPGQDGIRVPFKALIGLKTTFYELFFLLRFGAGDGLISWQGQRVHPELSCSDDSCETRALSNTASFVANNPQVFGNTVTEHFLGTSELDEVEALVPSPSTTPPEGFRPYAHSPKASESGMYIQTRIKRDEHVDVVPRQHDVLLAVLETLEEWTKESPPAATFPLNDTGITFGGNYPSGNNAGCTGVTIEQQDCSHGRDVTHNDNSDGHAGFSYTKLSSNGAELPASAMSWACVRDNVTGLVWEMKTDDGSIHDKDNTYRWGGKTAQGSGYGNYYPDWNTLVDGSNSDALCGFTDWRVPTPNEIQSLVNYSRPSLPAIDITWFPNAHTGSFWSASPAASGQNNAWYASSSGGIGEGDVERSYPKNVRLVHAGQ